MKCPNGVVVIPETMEQLIQEFWELRDAQRKLFWAKETMGRDHRYQVKLRVGELERKADLMLDILRTNLDRKRS